MQDDIITDVKKSVKAKKLPKDTKKQKEEECMSKFNVSASQVSAGVEQLREANAQFKTALMQLESLEEKLNGMWDGEANDSFHTAFNNDKQQMAEFYNTIEKYAQVLEGIVKRYMQAEANNAEIAKTRSY